MFRIQRAASTPIPGGTCTVHSLTRANHSVAMRGVVVVQGADLRKFAGVALVVSLLHLDSCFNMIELYFKYYDKSDKIQRNVIDCEKDPDPSDILQCELASAVSRGMFM